MKLFPRHRKLFYVPGMISLLLLPLLGYAYFHYNKSFAKYYSMDIGLLPKHPDDKSEKQSNQKFSKAIASRHFKTFVVDGSETSEELKLKTIQKEFSQLKKSGDTINGIKIHFGKRAHYDAFVRTIDFLAIENMPVWGLVEDDIYVLIPPPPKVTSPAFKFVGCGTGKVFFMHNVDSSESILAIISKAIRKDRKIWSAFSVLMLINIFAIIRFNRNKMLYLNDHAKWHF